MLTPPGISIPRDSGPISIFEVREGTPATRFEARDWWLTIVLGLLTLVTFLATLRCGFVDVDDPQLVYKNAHVISGMTLDGLRWAFSNIEQGAYLPLTWISFQLDDQLYALHAWGYHLTNVLLHSANAMLLFVFLRLSTGSSWRSAGVAAIFAVHPLRVESVAWVTERKDVLSAFFGFLTMIGYFYYAQQPCRRYRLVACLYTLSLLSKSMLVTLPCLLLVLDIWPLRRLKPPCLPCLGWLVLEKLPFACAAAVIAVATFVGQKRIGAVQNDRINLAERVENAFLSYVSYPEKMVWFKDLAIWYSFKQPQIWHAIAAATVVLLMTLLVVWTARRRPWLAVGWLWYLGTLVPMIGLVAVAGIAMADRFTYFPSIGLLIMVFGQSPIR